MSHNPSHHSHSEATCPSKAHHQRSILARKFDENDYGYKDVYEGTLQKQWWTFVGCPENTADVEPHHDAIVIAVDGACRDNGKAAARSGAGIFFHDDNHSWNLALKLEPEYNTSQRAELRAALEALRMAARLRKLNPSCSKRRGPIWPKGPQRRLRRVVIKADSSYLVNAMTDWIKKWNSNGFINAKGQRVTNEDMFRQLDTEIESLNELGVEVQFWHVHREENSMADRLANAGLDGLLASDVVGQLAGKGMS